MLLKRVTFLTQPVEVQENQVYPIANNGSASTPFYTALCLWVGAVLLSSLATTEVHLSDKDKNVILNVNNSLLEWEVS